MSSPATSASGPARGGWLLLLLLVSGLIAAGAAWTLGRPPSEAMAGRLLPDAWDTARIAVTDRDLPRAEKLLRELLASQPDRREVKLLLARVLCERGRTAEARDLFTGLQQSQNDPESLRGLGAVAEKDRQFELAVSFYRRAIELRKEDASLWRDLGKAQAAQRDSLGALASVQESLRLDPGQSDLVLLQSELAAAAQPRLPGLTRPGDPERLPGRPADVPVPSQPRVPDPTKMFPKPDGRMR